jgi:LAO/AO transport system kinase
MGDAVQANKAGLLEVADLFVVNKADRPGAADVRRDLELMLDLAHVTGADTDASGATFRPEIIMATATLGEGTVAVVDAIIDHFEHLHVSDRLERRRAGRVRAEIRSRAERELLDRLATMLHTGELDDIVRDSVASHRSPVQAAAEIVGRLTRNH